MAETAKVPRPFTMHWGAGMITEEARVSGEHHAPAIELMEYTDGEAADTWTVRFCSFYHRGAFQRSPLILDAENVAQLREALKQTPRLQEILRTLVG